MSDNWPDISERVVREIVDTYEDRMGINHLDGPNLPLPEVIYETLDEIFALLFPGYFGREAVTKDELAWQVGGVTSSIHRKLVEQGTRAFKYRCRLEACASCDCQRLAEAAACHLLASLPRVRELLKGDTRAAFEGDPAAKSLDEIILAYPAIEAIATHRVAHELYLKDVPLIPRIMSERAHSRTGIDLHPGARIGRNFFIDHGTGVVVGETTTIGDSVKLYQGVTLGAVSFPLDEHGNPIKGVKRHPDIESGVTIYANATILGPVRIGQNAVIGGNVWLIESVAANHKVSLKPTGMVDRGPGEKDGGGI